MTATTFITRLLTCRPLVFYCPDDHYVLRGGHSRGSGGFESIGTEEESHPLLLHHYLSYDEMAISALVGVSVPTFFLNSGGRDNCGVVAATTTTRGGGGEEEEEREGVYVGMVGSRFERRGLMEWKYMMVTPQQNTTANGYGPPPPPPPTPTPTTTTTTIMDAWAKYYGVSHFPTYTEAVSSPPEEYIQVGGAGGGRGGGLLLNLKVYKRRCSLSAQTYLLEANDRAARSSSSSSGSSSKRMAHVKVVGLGLGVWAVCEEQREVMVGAYREVVGSSSLPYVADIDFQYMGTGGGGMRSGDVIKDRDGHGIQVRRRSGGGDHSSSRSSSSAAISSHSPFSIPVTDYWQ